jgi:hypothetical protein
MGRDTKMVYTEIDIVKQRYPKLKDTIESEAFVLLSGQLDVIDENNTLWETYDVSIAIPKSYPDGLPALFETGNKIPKEVDRHINSDGSCCLAPRAKAYKILADEVNLLAWLDKLAIPFLANQFLWDKTHKFAGKEFSHYSQGIVEYYKELWGQLTVKEIVDRLKIIVGREIGRNEKCYCGSGKKFKYCHEKISQYENIPIRVYAMDLQDIQREYKI